MMTIFIHSALFLFAYATLWFVVSIMKKRNDIADIAWGLGYVLLCVFHALTQPLHPILIVCFVLIAIWGIRLSIFIYLRNKNKSEDFRYLKWRKEWGNRFYIRSYLQVFLLQAFFLLLVVSPVLSIVAIPDSSVSVFTLVGGIIWLIGFYWQSLGDYQLSHFIRDRKNSEEILCTGLWRYSRHPNYFGEVMMWWGIYVIVLPLSGTLFFIFGPITITLLIRYVSGVPMLERRYEGNVKYQAYKEQVPALFPRLK